MILLDLIRFLPIITILTIATYQDLTISKKEQIKIPLSTDKKLVLCGQVSNKLWLYTPIGLALTIIEYLCNPNPYLFVYAIIGTIIALAIYALNGWGGADTKALIMISLCIPATPTIFLPSAITILSAASIAALPITIIKKQKTLRYLPYILTVTIISTFL